MKPTKEQFLSGAWLINQGDKIKLVIPEDKVEGHVGFIVDEQGRYVCNVKEVTDEGVLIFRVGLNILTNEFGPVRTFIDFENFETI